MSGAILFSPFKRIQPGEMKKTKPDWKTTFKKNNNEGTVHCAGWFEVVAVGVNDS